MSVREELAKFISQDLLDSEELVAFDENLLSDGMVDSLGMLRLIAFIEAEFGIRVPPQDFTIENFRTINVLGDYLDGRTDE